MMLKRLCFLLFVSAAVPAAADMKLDSARIVPGVTVQRVTEAVWMHTGYYRFDETLCPSHGLIVVGKNGVILIDTQWDNSQTEDLLRQIESRFKKKVVLAVITHAHADKIGGIDALAKHGIETISTADTAAFAVKNGYSPPLARVASPLQLMTVEGVRMELFFPGAAHTKDNIVVYFPDFRILFSGCIVKGLKDTTLGNTRDGDAAAYPATLRNLLKRYSGAKIVITTHRDPGGTDLIEHSLKIAESAGK